MEHLDKSQYNFLTKLSKTEKIEYSSLSKEEIEIALFLEFKEFITIHRNSFPRLNSSTGKVENHYGKANSVSISEGGKAYLSEKKHELKKLLLKDVLVPIIVSLVTNLLIFAVKWLWPLMQ